MRQTVSTVLLAAFLLGGCSGFVTRTADNLSLAITNEADPTVVRDGAPAYLLLIDSFIQGDPENADLLEAGGRLYAAYASLFAQDPQRTRVLSARGFQYGKRALCSEEELACGLTARPYDQYVAGLQQFDDEDDVPVLYALSQTWLAYIQARQDDWKAVADLPKVQVTLEKVLSLDETYDHGGAHLYMGVLLSLRPAALGGKPEEARLHFERAIALSGGHNLMAKVEYAARYARLVFDRPLHDRLLHEVLDAPVEADGFTLLNVMAQERARQLLDSADDYF